MSKLRRWSISYDNKSTPCVITDRETIEILYCNQAFLSEFKLDSTVIGKFFYNVLNATNTQYKDAMPDWDSIDFYETKSYNHKNNKQYHLQAFIDRTDNSIFCEIAPYDQNMEDNIPFEEAMSRCMDLYTHPNENVLDSFMELLCQYYDCERGYVYGFSQKKDTIHCMAQWCSDPQFMVTEEIDTKMDASFLISWLESEKEAGIVSCNTENPDFDPESTLGKVISAFKLENLTLCPVQGSTGELLGVVGMSNRKVFQNFFDRRVITSISHFVAQDISKGTVDPSLFQLENRDSLTGLYNRMGYAQRIEEIKNQDPQSMGVISSNVNGLKYINDHQGIDEGDARIKKSALHIKSHFDFQIFRMSGDEFLGLSPNISKESFESLVNSLYSTMREEENYDFSLGYAWAQGALDFNKLMLEAETMMYINKQEYYSTSGRDLINVSNAILRDLLSFLENDEFFIYLQPQVRLEDGSLHGAEALIRRFDKLNKKMVFPDQFIPIYEQSSVIRHIDLFVVDKVCQLLQKWDKVGKSIPIAVNLSRVTLQEFGIVSTIVKICDKYQVPHNLLVIEVTERVGLIENNVASSLVQEFVNQDFTISLDDFGSAYSNIITLAQIDVDEVKIDKSLVDHLTDNRKNHILVKNVLSMCKELDGMSTLAEGIEDKAQSTLLHQLGCHLGQGYFYARPMPVEDFEVQYVY